jgi:probable addiction module antidote protein
MEIWETETFRKWFWSLGIFGQRDEEDVIGMLEAAFEENDMEFLLRVIGDISRSKDIPQLARELNLSRKGLYKAFSGKGNPSFITVAKVLDNLGFRLKVKQKAS